MSSCTNPAHRLLHLAPIPCHECHGWLDRDGSVLGTDAMLTRYPHMISVVSQQPRQQLPDYTPTRADRAWEINRLAGALARTLIMVLIAAIALGVIVLVAVNS
jgi:hypothetical protein